MKVLVIGKGSIGTRHFNNLGALGVAAEHIGWRGYSAAALGERLAADPDVGAVVIATATQVRLELITVCAAAGVPFYVEKPVAFRAADLAAVTVAAAPVAARSVAGFMMRYHPLFRELAQADLSDSFGFAFEIGHDVTQWRQNWRFSQSYAALPEGGGVLLDLCHELDMAAALFPGLTLGTVQCLGHAAYPGVDFATRIELVAPSGAMGAVAMDYLSPVFNRTVAIRGLRQTQDADLVASRCRIGGAGARAFALPFERNEMFLSAMRDFLALAEGRPTSGVEHLPRFDAVQESCALIAAAWEARRFTGQITKEIP